MKITFYHAKEYEIEFFNLCNQKFLHEIVYLEEGLNQNTVVLAAGFQAICTFVNGKIDRDILLSLQKMGVSYIALRCAGFNQVDLKSVREIGMKIVRVPDYSPYAVAEHTVALILTLNRKTHRAFNRIRENNFSLNGLLGFDLKGKTVGVIGTGKIGEVFCRIMKGFGCHVIAYDISKNRQCEKEGVEYVLLNKLYQVSDIISLHCPLTSETHHLINEQALLLMKNGVMLINTSRGALVDTKVVIKHLKNGKIGYLGLDVYEEEGGLFFEDLSEEVLRDDIFARLLTFSNVLITGHQAFFTSNALHNIAETTLQNLSDLESTGQSTNEIKL